MRCQAVLEEQHDGEAVLRGQWALVDTIRLLDDGLELLFRRVVQCRVCSLNTCNFDFHTYYLRPFISITVGVRITSLTRFIENMCNICISK
jgi:hypothetical protein